MEEGIGSQMLKKLGKSAFGLYKYVCKRFFVRKSIKFSSNESVISFYI